MINNCIQNIYSCYNFFEPYFLIAYFKVNIWIYNNIVLNSNFGYKNVSFNTTVNDIENNLYGFNNNINNDIKEFNDIVNEIGNLVNESDDEEINSILSDLSNDTNVQKISLDSDNESDTSDIEYVNINDTNYRMKNINSDYGEFVDITALNS